MDLHLAVKKKRTKQNKAKISAKKIKKASD
jgi:hypothetical protein